MKARWLFALVCVCITACSEPEAANTPGETEPAVKEAMATAAKTADAKEASETSANAMGEEPGETTGEVAEPAAVLTASEKYDQLIGEFNKARGEAIRLARAEKDRSKQGKVYQDNLPDADEYAVKFMEIADANPEDEAAFKALLWVAGSGSDRGDEAFDVLMKKHIENEGLLSVCSALLRGLPGEKTEQRFQDLMEKSPHDEVKAAATFFYANYFNQLDQFKKNIDQMGLDDETVAYVKAYERDEAKIESLYQRLIDDFGDLKPNPRSGTYAVEAENALFAMKYLAIGKVAPEIEAEDLDGETFKLSDYRGKVVVLDFWGDW